MLLSRTIVLFLLSCVITNTVIAGKYTFYSPDKKTIIAVEVQQQIRYSITHNNQPVILSSAIAMLLNDGEVLGKNAHVLSVKNKFVNTILYPVLKEKNATIPDIYNEYILQCKEGFSIAFRAYNDGVAYRFSTQKKTPLIITNEEAAFNFPTGAVACFAPVKKREDADIFHTSFEGFYQSAQIDTLNKDYLFFSPVLISIPGSLKLILTESDIMDYPGMFLQKGEGNSLTGVFAPYPAKEKVVGGDGFRQSIVNERANYIATTKGNRTFPWRIIAIAPTDASILTNDIVYRLASPSTLTNTSWIKPGKSTEEWITDLNLYGVDFKAGLNTATYKYYVDFAEKFGLNYVMLDAGWSDVNDLFAITKGIDVKEIIRYAAERNIGIILWTQAETMSKQMTAALDSFKTWGVKIVMTDFIDRDDQKAINFINHFADECAKRELMAMIHGAPKPAGFSRTHPNALTREAVAGSEYNAWSDLINPTHDMVLPFLRMFSGTMDYEPGILQNATKKHTEKMGMEKVIAQGTTMHQIAMFVVYESPLQLFSGNISDAFRQPELMNFFGTIPTVWDETIIKEAKFPQYIVEARRNGNDWFIGAMNDWTPKDFSMPLDFLGAGEYEATICADGINAERNANDYSIKVVTVKKGDQLPIHLASGGGYVAHIKPKK
jgi:alpha-glucosidase